MRGNLPPSETRLISHVLFFGLTFEQWLFEKACLKSAMQNIHMGWQVSSSCANDIPEAEFMIATRPDLEVVFIRNPNRRTPDQLRYVAQRLAHQLILHETHPWVSYEPELDGILRPIFEAEYLTVDCGSEDQVVIRRWQERVKLLRAA